MKRAHHRLPGGAVGRHDRDRVRPSLGHHVVQGEEHGQCYCHDAGQPYVLGGLGRRGAVDDGRRGVQVLVEGGGRGPQGAGGLHGPAVARVSVLIVAADADSGLALAGAGVLVPLALKVRRAGGLEGGELGLAAAQAGALVEDFIVVAVGDGALAPAGSAVLLHVHRGAQLMRGGRVGADDDVDLGEAGLFRLAIAARAFQAQS